MEKEKFELGTLFRSQLSSRWLIIERERRWNMCVCTLIRCVALITPASALKHELASSNSITNKIMNAASVVHFTPWIRCLVYLTQACTGVLKMLERWRQDSHGVGRAMDGKGKINRWHIKFSLFQASLKKGVSMTENPEDSIRSKT